MVGRREEFVCGGGGEGRGRGRGGAGGGALITSTHNEYARGKKGEGGSGANLTNMI